MLHHDVLRNVLHFLDRNNLDVCCYVTRLWNVLINADSAKTLAVHSVEVAQIKVLVLNFPVLGVRPLKSPSHHRANRTASVSWC